jgi:purine-binding chemotaxis protein CheW
VLDFSKKQKQVNITRTQYLTFDIGEEIYGIKLTDNKEVINPPRITSVPYTEDYVLGVINLRGQIIPVIDLKVKLHLSDSKESDSEGGNKIIVVQFNDMLVGIMVDRVQDVVGINKEEVEEIHESKGSISQEFIEGVFTLEDNLIIIIKIKEILFGNKEGREEDSA